jgi:hypothetical protein
MPENSARPGGSGGGGIAALGIAMLAIGCCAGVPLIAALVGSVAVGTLLGVGAGIVVAIMLVAAVVVRIRARRRGGEPPASRRRSGTSQRESALPRHQ